MTSSDGQAEAQEMFRSLRGAFSQLSTLHSERLPTNSHECLVMHTMPAISILEDEMACMVEVLEADAREEFGLEDNVSESASLKRKHELESSTTDDQKKRKVELSDGSAPASDASVLENSASPNQSAMDVDTSGESSGQASSSVELGHQSIETSLGSESTPQWIDNDQGSGNTTGESDDVSFTLKSNLAEVFVRDRIKLPTTASDNPGFLTMWMFRLHQTENRVFLNKSANDSSSHDSDTGKAVRPIHGGDRGIRDFIRESVLNFVNDFTRERGTLSPGVWHGACVDFEQKVGSSPGAADFCAYERDDSSPDFVTKKLSGGVEQFIIKLWGGLKTEDLQWLEEKAALGSLALHVGDSGVGLFCADGNNSGLGLSVCYVLEQIINQMHHHEVRVAVLTNYDCYVLFTLDSQTKISMSPIIHRDRVYNYDANAPLPVTPMTLFTALLLSPNADQETTPTA